MVAFGLLAGVGFALSLPLLGVQPRLRIDGSPRRGASKARLTVYEFGDYGCTACKRAHSRVESLVTAYGGEVLWIWKNVPGSPEARVASRASIAAFRQGEEAFWNFHSTLLTMGRLPREPQDYGTLASRAGLDGARLVADMATPEVELQIARDVELAHAVGAHDVSPVFFVNGRRIIGFVPRFDSVVAAELGGAGEKLRSRLADVFRGDPISTRVAERAQAASRQPAPAVGGNPVASTASVRSGGPFRKGSVASSPEARNAGDVTTIRSMPAVEDFVTLPNASEFHRRFRRERERLRAQLSCMNAWNPPPGVDGFDGWFDLGLRGREDGVEIIDVQVVQSNASGAPVEECMRKSFLLPSNAKGIPAGSLYRGRFRQVFYKRGPDMKLEDYPVYADE